MGYVYYGNYPAYYEVGRTEALRQLGTSYHELEKKGIMMPVIDLSIKYLKPAKYDDLLTIKTIVKEIPKMRMHFFYEVYNSENILLNKGETTLVFISMERNRPVACPEWLKTIFENSFNIAD
jgi:acyl-CoA thioester hydrolase